MGRNKNYINEIKKDLGMVNRKRSMFMESILCDDDMLDNDVDTTDQSFEETDEFDENYTAEEEFKSIRQIALKGITVLAENPSDANYNTLKKIWALCDKALEGIIASKGENNNEI